jgi:RNA polymerase sigma factor (sigma-70 family)
MSNDNLISQEFLNQWNLVKSELYKYIIYFVFDQDQADDIMQSTAELAYTKYHGQISNEIFKYQLFNIAKKKFFEYNRKIRRQSKEVSYEMLKENLSGQNNLLENQEDDLADIIIEYELRDDLKKVVSQLPNFDQQLIFLRYKKSLSFKKIAKILGKSDGALRTYHYRLINKIYKLITEKDKNDM